jgi:hypothetical protein
MSSAKRRVAEAIIDGLQQEKQLASASTPRRRYGRSTRSVAVCAHLWPDVMELVRQHANQHQLTPSGAVHDALRRYFKLPPIN